MNVRIGESVMEKKTMEFEINNGLWTIEEVSEEEMIREGEKDYTLGLTIYKLQRILLLRNQKNIKKTLVHELMHVWLYEYGHNAQDRQFNHEDVCEIVASCNDFVSDIAKRFLR